MSVSANQHERLQATKEFTGMAVLQLERAENDVPVEQMHGKTESIAVEPAFVVCGVRVGYFAVTHRSTMADHVFPGGRKPTGRTRPGRRVERSIGTIVLCHAAAGGIECYFRVRPSPRTLERSGRDLERTSARREK